MFYFQGMVSDSGMLSLPECSSPAEFSQCEGCHSDALDRRASVTQFLLLSLWSCPCCWYVVEHVVHVIVHRENEIHLLFQWKTYLYWDITNSTFVLFIHLRCSFGAYRGVYAEMANIH